MEKKNILETIRSFEYDKNDKKIFGIKSAIVWGHSSESNCCYPLFYISKPKHISEEDFKIIKNKIKIDILK